MVRGRNFSFTMTYSRWKDSFSHLLRACGRVDFFHNVFSSRWEDSFSHLLRTCGRVHSFTLSFLVLSMGGFILSSLAGLWKDSFFHNIDGRIILSSSKRSWKNPFFQDGDGHIRPETALFTRLCKSLLQRNVITSLTLRRQSLFHSSSSPVHPYEGLDLFVQLYKLELLRAQFCTARCPRSEIHLARTNLYRRCSEFFGVLHHSTWSRKVYQVLHPYAARCENITTQSRRP
jgi:hypothetical protein